MFAISQWSERSQRTCRCSFGFHFARTVNSTPELPSCRPQVCVCVQRGMNIRQCYFCLSSRITPSLEVIHTHTHTHTLLSFPGHYETLLKFNSFTLSLFNLLHSAVMLTHMPSETHTRTHTQSERDRGGITAVRIDQLLRPLTLV